MTADGAPTPVRSIVGLAAACARAWWPQVAALAAASGIVSATIAGALGVGDSLARGLLDVARARLGRIDSAVLGEDVFRVALADELAHAIASSAATRGVTPVPAMVLEIIVERPAAGDRRSGQMRATLLACDDPAALGFAPGPPSLPDDKVALNRSLADVLGVAAGDAVVLRMAVRSEVPADSPLGRRRGESTSRRVRVAAVLPEGGIGDFAVRPTQVTSGLVLTRLGVAQALLGQEGVANAIFCVGGDRVADGDAIDRVVRECLRPRLADYGLSFGLPAGVADPAAMRLTSRRLLLDREVDRAAETVLGPLGGRPTLVFLATAIAPVAGGGSIPYSTVAGIDTTSLPVGDLIDADGRPLSLPRDGDIVIDQWIADDLAAQGSPVGVGDELVMTVFEPETVHGRVVEQTLTLRISGVAAMRGAAVAGDLVPDVEGVTDEESIADWDPPFPFDRSRVRSTPPHDEDERYWREHRAAPKAFVSLSTARRIAGSRFGETTAWHVPADSTAAADAAREALADAIDPVRLGIRVVPLAREAAAAARGSTPFGLLFLALSMFIVAAGLILEWLLFHLLVAAHRRDLGILAAVGWPARRLGRLLVLVSALAVAAGAGIGLFVAPLWSQTLVAGLGWAWNASVAVGSRHVFGAASPRLQAMWPGAVGAAAVSLVAVWWAARRIVRTPPWSLVRGATGTEALRGGRPRQVARSLAHFAWRNVASRPLRAVSIAAIVAMAEFLVVVVSAFALRPPARTGDRASPTGGWTHLVTFAEPTGIDPTDPDTAALLGLSADEQDALAHGTIARLRSNRGDDASCTNLYAATRPTVLGVGESFIDRGGFRFVSHAPLPAGEANPWTLLRRAAGGPIPAILDQATAQWALTLGGVGARFTLPGDEPRELEVVGLLEPGILQGAVIVSESDFARLEPRVSGYGMALVDAGTVPVPLASRAIAAAWADAGPAVQLADERLRSLYAVHNTFLAGFQALGTLGLLLGTLGVAAVQMQGLFERRGEFAVLRAVGFTLRRLRGLLILETVIMISAGVSLGAGAALVVLAPLMVSGRANLPAGWLAVSALAALVSALAAGFVAARGGMIPIRPVGE